MGRLRGIASRVKRKIAGQKSVGEGFGPSQDMAFARLDANADAAFQLIGASLVGTWEIFLTDLSRALSPTMEVAESRPLLDRISDALVPTQGPLQTGGRNYRKSLKHGVQTGLQSGTLSDATEAILVSMADFPEEMSSGWLKTVDYLEPIFTALDPDGVAEARFRAGGGELLAILNAQNDAYSAAMRALPQAEDLDRALTDALDIWRAGVVRGIEVTLYDKRTALVEAAGRRKS
ncbi:MAG: hypothetical protein ACI8RZ_007596 [Myxococcota bacterium]|jgi:hypothetical protein